MSSFIPPILSSSPPPMDAVDDEEDDFGDFAAANYSSKEDNLVSKLNLDDSSWNGPGLNSPPTQPSTPVKQNGTIPNHIKSGNSGPADWGPNEDEETQQQTDNTSQNSVVSGGSGVTDSGLCSASQNSEGVSPLPQVDLVEEEAESQTLSNSVVACDNSETVNGGSPINVEDSVEDASSKSEESGGSIEESNSGFVSRRSSSPPDLDLDVSGVCKPEESSNGVSDTSFAPNPDDWGGTGDDDFGDFSAFDPPPPLNLGEDSPPLNLSDSPPSDLSPEEEVREDSFQFKEDLEPLKLEPVEPESIVAAEEGDVRTLPVESSDVGDTNEVSDFEGAYIPAKTDAEETLGADEAGIEKAEPPCPVAVSDEEDDDFADFESAQPAPVSEPPQDAAHSFADFSNIGSCPPVAEDSGPQWATPSNPPDAPERSLSALSDDDEFGDFESDAVQPTSFSCQDVQQRLPQVLSEMFPPVQQPEESVLSDESNRTDELRLNMEDSGTWQSLRDFESTPALSFHWPGSHANRCLLAALNIDSRNVLFGPKWSTVVPRFASNLSFSPLEPVRAGQMQPPEESHSKQPEPVMTPQPVNPTPVLPLELQDVVPAAQFDWSGSGLENPLECKWKAETGPPSSSSAPAPAPAPSPSSLSAAPTAPAVPPPLSAPSPSPPPAPTPLPLPLQPALAPVTSPVTPPLKSTQRDPTLSPEAVRVLDSLPELAFLSAKKLMFPVYGEMASHKH